MGDSKRSGAAPTAACLLALTPWLARGDGMDSLGTVVMMMIFGVEDAHEVDLIAGR
jgi:hypothetical protein